MGVKNLEPYRHMCWIYILWHCRFSMDFPIKKPCFIKTVVFGWCFYLHRSQKTHDFLHRWAQGAHLHRHYHQALKVSSCGGHLYHGHGKKGYGHLTMMRNPSDDCTNPYKWWLNNRISLIQSSISASLWMRSAWFVYFPIHPYPSLSIPINPCPSLSIPIHPYPYAYSISEPQE